MTDDREPLGRIVRETWVAWAKEQPDVRDHPSWLVPWDDLPARDREVDMRIGSAAAAEVSRRWEGERAELTLARLSRSARLAQIRNHCRHRLDAAIAQGPVSDLCRHILGIIGDEEGSGE
jgi:hypothetical protein